MFNTLTTNIVGIAIGNFDGITGNNIAIINNSNNPNIKIFNYTKNTNSFTNIASFNAASDSYDQWNGIAAGDFDGDGKDEIITHRNWDGDFFVFKLNSSNQIVNNYKESFPINQQNGVIGSIRSIIDPTKDYLISLRNYDGNMFAYSLEGLCKGLHLSNQTIDDTYSLGNNYNIDYHVNNTLIAGNNFTITSGSNVTFTSGKEIILLPGFTSEDGSDFDAYIDPALECNPSTFKKATNSKQFSMLEKKDSKNFEDSNIEVKPNPNNGSFQITILKNNKPIGINEIKIYDILGNVVWTTTKSTSNIFEVNISTYSKGIYFVKSINESGDIDTKKVIKQ